MQLTELIKLCNEALAEYADVEVIVYGREDIHAPEVTVEIVLGPEKQFVIR